MSKTVRALDRVIHPQDVLRLAGLEPDDFEPRHGWSNRAWIGQRYVVRISSGRFDGAFEHERRVVDVVARAGVPVATVLASGTVDALPGQDGEAGEWIVSARLRGDTLAALWPRLDEDGRTRVGRRVGEILRTLHRIDIEPVAPRWWTAAHRPPLLRNAYRPPVALGASMVRAARELPGADHTVLNDAEAMLRERLPVFDSDVSVLVHGDIHGHNVLVSDLSNPLVSGVLDWEGAHTAPPDVELDMLLRWAASAHDFPESPSRPSRIAPGECARLVDDVAAAYPALFAVPDLEQRLEVYEALWHLVQLLFDGYWKANNPHQDQVRSPSWTRLRALLEGQSHIRAFGL